MKRKIFIYDYSPPLTEYRYSEYLNQYLNQYLNRGYFLKACLVFNDIIYVSYKRNP